MGRWPGAYRADKRRKELDRLKNRDEKEKRMAERRAAQRAYDIAHGIIPPDPPDGTQPPAPDTAGANGATAPVTTEAVTTEKK